MIARIVLANKNGRFLVLANKWMIIKRVFAHKKGIVMIVLTHNRSECQDSVGS